MATAVKQAAEFSKGVNLDEEQALYFAITALGQLLDLTDDQSGVFRVLDAKAALIEALTDSRDEVTFGSADVLAKLPTADSQRALLESALKAEDRGDDVQVHLLKASADSARINGRQVEEIQIKRLHDLLESASSPEVAEAAAEAYGALTLPTKRSVDLITK